MNSAICFDGRLEETPVPLVLHRIVQRRAKGTLTLARPSERIHLFFVDGELKAANSTRAGMRLGDALLVHGVLPEEEFEEAVHSVKGGRGGRIGKILVQKGLVSRNVLDAETRSHFEEIFFSCFAWREGDFGFLPSSGQLDSDVSLDLPTAALIIEGVRRESVNQPDVKALGDPAFFGRATPLTTELQSLRLSSEEAYFLSLCDGKTRLRDILRLGRSRVEGAQTLYTLLACGLIEFVPGSSGAVSAAEDVPFLPSADSWDAAAEADPQARDERARAAYTEALASLAKGNYPEAIVLLQECVRLFPDNVEYRFQLGGALSRNPLWRRRALVQYREALDLDPFREELLFSFAELLLAEKKFAAALEIARRLDARYPNSPRNQSILDRCRSAAASPPDSGEVGRLLEHGGWVPSPRFRETPH
ncbi:MAG TPA: DUF4388 domain-containing protein [Thermoanaerobaculia bacterium]|nr:DUF4388 domain-containing protein [Thermoanaerobaculia bacterium]